nr:MAG TPA: hypothetical protein [Caudoviricetes sp.]
MSISRLTRDASRFSSFTVKSDIFFLLLIAA